jgi:hypothetical protein
MNSPGHMADVLALRRLHGHKPDRAGEIHDACRTLETMTAPWRTFPPRSTGIADAIRQCEGIASALRSMRDEQGGPPNDEAA